MLMANLIFASRPVFVQLNYKLTISRDGTAGLRNRTERKTKKTSNSKPRR